jgi:hypothetical protein
VQFLTEEEMVTPQMKDAALIGRMRVCLLGGQVPGFFKLTVNLLSNPLGGHAHEARLQIKATEVEPCPH